MKQSKAITLVLLTSSLFLGCENKVRNQYGSWDDCVRDYQDSSKCESATEQKGGPNVTLFSAFKKKCGQALGPVLGGWIKDTTGTFTNAFVLATIVSLVGGFGSLILKKRA
jgi:uncharacterized protein YgiB involved in biofilm formation